MVFSSVIFQGHAGICRARCRSAYSRQRHGHIAVVVVIDEDGAGFQARLMRCARERSRVHTAAPSPSGCRWQAVAPVLLM